MSRSRLAVAVLIAVLAGAFFALGGHRYLTLEQLRSAGLAAVDPEIARLLEAELERQRGDIELIASENFTWRATLEGVGSVPTNKYSEGYPGRRYYGGCEVVDEIEQLAIDRAKSLFGADHANVQPHAGAQTNMAVYFACLEPGDTILSLELSHGGHLTHGLKVNFSGRLYDIVHYGVSRETYVVDYDEVLALAREHRPKLIVCGGSAYPRTVEAERFRDPFGSVRLHLVLIIAACSSGRTPRSAILTRRPRQLPIGSPFLSKRSLRPGSLWQKSWQTECLPHQPRKLLIPDGRAGGFA